MSGMLCVIVLAVVATGIARVIGVIQDAYNDRY